MVIRHGKPNCHGTPVLNLINVMVILEGPVRSTARPSRALQRPKAMQQWREERIFLAW